MGRRMVGVPRSCACEQGAQVAARLDVVDPALRPRQIAWALPLKLVSALLGLIALGWLLGLLVHGAPNGLDRSVLRFVVDNRSSWKTSVAGALTNLGAPVLLLVVAVGLGWAWWAWRRTPIPLVLLVISWLGAEVLFNVVKLLVDRPRPPIAVATEGFGGLAFPSGHATQAVAVWGMAAALGVLSVRSHRDQVVVVVLAVAFAIVVGATRVYLGAHWTTDVVGGWLLGALWVMAVLWMVRPSQLLRGASQLIEGTV
jgi:membrane-associated phospholipid phosphatase